MARLTESDKKSFRDLTERGWVQSGEERSPVFVVPNLENNEAYCRWVSDVSKMSLTNKEVRFSGRDWKL